MSQWSARSRTCSTRSHQRRQWERILRLADVVPVGCSRWVEEWSRRPSRAVVEEFYRRALTRSPGPAELAEWEALLSRGPDRREAVQDLLWTLLNSREFALNH